MYKKLPHFSVQIYVWYGSKVWIGITVAMKKKNTGGEGGIFFSCAPVVAWSCSLCPLLKQHFTDGARGHRHTSCTR
jgi:hypothetical protein